jgi:hypothetical protein
MSKHIIDKMVDTIKTLNPALEREAISYMVHYKLSALVSNLKVCIDYQEGRKPAPINFYSLVLLRSGGGKNSTLEALDEWYFSSVFAKLEKIFTYNKMKYLKQFEEDEEEYKSESARLANWSPSVGNATEAAMLQLAQTLNDIGFGTASFEVDEIDKFISTKEEMINNLYGAYDNGVWPSKALKSEKTRGQIKGVAPNFFGFGTYEALMLNDSVADVFRDKLQSGLARRMFFYHEDTDKLVHTISALERLELDEKAKTMGGEGESLSNYLLSLLVQENENKVMTFERDAKLKMYEYRAISDELAQVNKDAILQAEYAGRHFKTAKTAGMYAFIDGRDVITADDVELAIKFSMSSTESLKRIIQGKSKLERLYLRIRAMNRFVDTNEALEFGIYPSTLTKAIKQHFVELEDISIKYGDVYEHMEIGSILSVKIRQLISTNEESCIMSASMPINGKPNHGDGYKKAEIPFDEIGHWITQDNVCYSGTTFRGGKRNNESSERLSNLIILDVDDGMSMEYAKELFADYYCIIAPTRNHRKEKNGVVADRFRIILLSDKYLETTPETYSKLMKNISKYYSVNVDEACFDKAHIFYGNQTDDIWTGACNKKFSVSKLIPKEEGKKQAITPYVPEGGGVLKAWFEQELQKACGAGTGIVTLLAKAGLGSRDTGMFDSQEEAEDWLHELHAKVEEKLPEYWERHNFEKEVMSTVEKAWS